jgi:hypothetical protein
MVVMGMDGFVLQGLGRAERLLGTNSDSDRKVDNCWSSVVGDGCSFLNTFSTT